ncbi:MAG: hypothetical protein LBG84_04530 [Treponema sp.]|jgi:hypothetical protein|nr:hypothetical protein [Treponema sp.]
MKRQLFVWTVLVSLACACSTETALQRLLGIETVTPVFYGCKTPSDGEVHFLFSSGVKVTSLYFDPPMETEILSQGDTLVVRFNSALPGGSKITADILVEDKRGNTLNVLAGFRTRNSRVPDLVINEIRTEYSSSTNTAGVTKYNVEFIELKARQAGNLGAVRIFAAGYGKEPIFEFPPVEVAAGEYVVLHTRTVEAEKDLVVDETGANKSESRGSVSISGVRDFWIPLSKKLLHKTDVIYVMDQDDRIIDGVVMKEEDKPWKEPAAAAAELLFGQGAWNGPAPEDAFNSTNTTAARTICRVEDQDSGGAADWYIVDSRGTSSGSSPGTRNNTKRY